MLDGKPYLLWPPLFPTLLAAMGLSGIDPLELARYVNAIAFGLTVFLGGAWVYRHTRSPLFALLGAGAILLSKPLMANAIYALTEALFVLFSLAFVIAIEDFLARRRMPSLLLAAALAALAFLTRYAGMAVVAAGALLLALYPGFSLRERTRNVVIFGVMACLLAVAWQARNYAISGTLTGPRIDSPYSLGQNLYITGLTLTTWSMPVKLLPSPLQEGIAILFPLVAGVVLALAIAAISRASGTALLPVLIMLGFFVVYTGWLVTSATLVKFDTIGHRLLSPGYAPLALAIVLIGQKAHVWLGRSRIPGSAAVIPTALTVWLLYQGAWTTSTLADAVRHGAGDYATVEWQESEFMAYLREHLPSGKLYTNAPGQVSWFNGTLLELSPERYRDGIPEHPSDDLERLRAIIDRGGPVYLAWFDNRKDPSLYDIRQLQSWFHLEEIARVSDGAIYHVR